MKFHYQNLNEEKYSKQKSILKYGRCWIGPFEIEWSVRPSFKFAIILADPYSEEAITISAGFIFFVLYVSYNNYKLRSWIESKVGRKGYIGNRGREIGFNLSGGNLILNIWSDGEWSKEDPWYKSTHCIELADVFLGKAKYKSTDLHTEEVIIPMPEGGYPAIVTISEDTWSRPRWFKKTIIRSNIDMIEPIPFPGKGENSWDAGDDALYSISGPHDTPLKAVTACVESVMKSRIKYGSGWTYKPEKGDTCG